MGVDLGRAIIAPYLEMVLSRDRKGESRLFRMRCALDFAGARERFKMAVFDPAGQARSYSNWMMNTIIRGPQECRKPKNRGAMPPMDKRFSAAGMSGVGCAWKIGYKIPQKPR